MKYKEGKRARRGSFQNCLADMLILADADNGGKKGRKRGERSRGGGGGEEATNHLPVLCLLPLASCQNCLADMLLYADVGSYEQFEE